MAQKIMIKRVLDYTWHGAGPVMAQKIMIKRVLDYEHEKNLVREILNISHLTDWGNGVADSGESTGSTSCLNLPGLRGERAVSERPPPQGSLWPWRDQWYKAQEFCRA